MADMVVKVPVSEFDINLFIELTTGCRDSFTWTYESVDGIPVDLVFVREGDGDE